jgi:hypothetical protein
MIFPASADRSVVIFKVWPSLVYRTRLLASLGLIVAGLVIQLVTESFAAGAILIAAGNLLLLVSGYHNRVEFGKFDPAAEWTRVELERLAELRKLDREIRQWDVSSLDVSNPLGAVVFILVALGLGALAFLFPGPARILALDAALLLLPHWLTGIRSVLRLPNLLVKVETLHSVFDQARDDLGKHKVHLLMLLRGEGTRVPDDVKIRVDPAGKHEDFLGLYGQVVLNEVQGKSYPYFYVVLVARRGFGLTDVYRAYSVPGGITSEFKLQDEVEVLVIRQTTTKTSGYHTESWMATSILQEGLRLAERVAAGGAGDGRPV